MYWIKQIVRGWIFLADVLALAVAILLTRLFAPGSYLLISLCDRLSEMEEQSIKELEDMDKHDRPD